MNLTKTRSLYIEFYKFLNNLNPAFMNKQLKEYIEKNIRKHLVLEVYVYIVQRCGSPSPIVLKLQKIDFQKICKVLG